MISTVFSVGIEFTNLYGSQIGYSYFYTEDVLDSSYIESHKISGVDVNGLVDYGEAELGETGWLFVYPNDSEDLVFKSFEIDYSFETNQNEGLLDFNKYQQGPNNELNGVCQSKGEELFFDNQRNLVLETSSTLNPLQTSNGDRIRNKEVLEEKDLLSKYYYMKSYAFVEIKRVSTSEVEYVYFENDDSSTYFYSSPAVTQSQIENMGGVYLDSLTNLNADIPFIELQDGLARYSIDYQKIQEKKDILCGQDTACDLEFTAHIVPIDGKCDQDDNNLLQDSIDFQAQSTPTITLPNFNDLTCEDDSTLPQCNTVEQIISQDKTIDIIDSDKDGVIDKYEFASCVGEQGKVFFGGCEQPQLRTAFEEVSCDDDVELIGISGNQKIYCGWGILDLLGSTNYVVYNQSDPQGSSSGSTLTSSYSSTYQLDSTNNAGFYSCIDTKLLSGEEFKGTCEIKKIQKNVLPPHKMYDKFRNLKINSSDDSVEIVDATKTGNKLIYNYETEDYYFVSVDGTQEILNDFQPFRNSLDVFVDGDYREKELLSSDLYALDAFMIKPFASKDEMESFIHVSSDIMKQTNISKSISIEDNKKEVKLSMDNLSKTQPTTIYMIFEKTLTIDQIIPKSSSGTFFIQEKDPIIGWYFNESSGDEEIVYEVPEGGDEGTIIITQEPILYNEGELIVNYRNTQCNPDEIELFGLDSLEASNVYEPGLNKNFKVCLAHVEEDIGTLGEFGNSFAIGNITPSNLVSQTQSGIEVGASFDLLESNGYFWDLKVQELNPDGTYSCVGSFGNNDPSTFGDCGFNPEKRLWLHFGSDTLPPQTSINVPFLSHTIYVDITIEEQPISGSGLSEVSYCVVEQGGSCDPFTDGKTKSISGSVHEFRIQESCPFDWGCRKTLRITSKDNFGNVEPIKEFDLNIIDKGSSCQSSCLSVPSPDRYLKECRNLNGCQYYNHNNDDGEKVATLCDLQLRDTWVKLNVSHDIQCPSGPIRPTQFTTEPLEIFSSQCRQLRTIPYPIVFNGESMIMNIVSCIE